MAWLGIDQMKARADLVHITKTSAESDYDFRKFPQGHIGVPKQWNCSPLKNEFFCIYGFYENAFYKRFFFFYK